MYINIFLLNLELATFSSLHILIFLLLLYKNLLKYFKFGIRYLAPKTKKSEKFSHFTPFEILFSPPTTKNQNCKALINSTLLVSNRTKKICKKKL